MLKALIGRPARQAGLVSGVALLATACSQGSGPPSRGVGYDASRPSLTRPLFTEREYGVSSSPRIAGPSGPVRKGGGSFKLGSPYKVAGRWYVPREEPGYDRQGTGSWYGDDFHGRKTANGEIFDMNALSAAHPTLPLPSYAYVTNQTNGRTILVRVNDRGPYVSDRIIDLSHASARALGYESQGRAPVRVRYAGRAPLNGDDRRERQYYAEQSWSGRSGYAVASYRPPSAPISVPQPFPAGTPGRWSPVAYRAALAGKPAPLQAPLARAAFAAPDIETSSAPAGRSALAGPTTGASRIAFGNPSGSRAYVQVGVFRDRSNAERMRRDLAQLGPVEVAPIVAQGGELYRVRLGPMSADTATSTASEVAARGVSGGTVIFE